MKRCISGKKSYPTIEIAEDALIEAHTRYDYGRTSGPIAVYQCEECGQFHLTGKAPMNERLAQYIKEGNIRRASEAAKWERKLRRH